MNLSVLHLLGRFPVLYERAIHREILSVGRLGVHNRIAAFHASPDAPDEEFATLATQVAYLDVARELGRWPSAALSMLAAASEIVRSPSAAAPCLAPAVGSRVAAFWRRTRLAALLRRYKPDTLHVHFGHLGLEFLHLIERAGVPMILSFRGQDVMLVSRAGPQERERLFASARRVLVRSEDMRRDVATLGCAQEKIFVQPSGIDVKGIPFSERKPPQRGEELIILMVGRLVPKKGMDDALRAVARLKERPRVRVIGDGPELAALRVLARQLGLSERVEFLGALPHSRLMEHMLAAHLFLLACRTAPDGEKEGIPNSLKEAQASGLPVISTRHAGIPECVEHGGSGLLAPEGDVAELSRCIDTLLSNPSQWALMGRRGRALMGARYDANALAISLVEHYRAVTGTGA